MRVKHLFWNRLLTHIIVLLILLPFANGKATAAVSTPIQVEFGSLVPSHTPHYSSTRQHIFVHSPDVPWSLYAKASTNLRGQGDSRNTIPIQRLEWSIDGNHWSVCEGTGQEVLFDQPPTGTTGLIVGIDYRLHVSWDDVPDLYTAEVLYTLAGGGTLATSYISPNPFNPREHESVALNYCLQTASAVCVEIHDEEGGLMFEGVALGEAGWNRFSWDGVKTDGEYPVSGQYYYRITTPDGIVAAGIIDIESSWTRENAPVVTTLRKDPPGDRGALQLAISPSVSTASVGDAVVVLLEVTANDDLVGGVLEIELPPALSPVYAKPAPESQSQQELRWLLPRIPAKGVFRVELGVTAVPGVPRGIYEIKARANGHFGMNRSSTAVEQAAINIRDEPLFTYGRVIGRVVDESGLMDKLDGLFVFIEGLGTIKTGAFGFFECKLPPGRYLARLDKSSLPTGISATPPVAPVEISAGSSARVIFRLMRQTDDERPDRWGYLRMSFDEDWPSLIGGISIDSKLGRWSVRGDWWSQQTPEELEFFRDKRYAWTSSTNQLRFSHDNVEIRVGEDVSTLEHIFGTGESIAVRGVNASWDRGGISVGRELNGGIPYFSAVYDYPLDQQPFRLTLRVRDGKGIGLAAATTRLVNLGKIDLDGSITRSSANTWGGALGLGWERQLSVGRLGGALRLRLDGRPEVDFGVGWNRSEGSFGFGFGLDKTFHATARTGRGNWRLDVDDSSPWSLSWQAADGQLTLGVGSSLIDLSGRHEWGNEGALLWFMQPGRRPLLAAYDDKPITSWQVRLGKDAGGELGFRFGPWDVAGGWGQGIWGAVSRCFEDFRLELNLGANDNKADIGLAAAYVPRSGPLWVQAERYWSASGAAGGAAAIHIGWDGSLGMSGSLIAKEEGAGGTQVLTRQAALGISLPLGSHTNLFGQGLRLWQSPSGERIGAWAFGLQKSLWQDLKIKAGWQFAPEGKTLPIYHQGAGPFLEIGWW